MQLGPACGKAEKQQKGLALLRTMKRKNQQKNPALSWGIKPRLIFGRAGLANAYKKSRDKPGYSTDDKPRFAGFAPPSSALPPGGTAR